MSHQPENISAGAQVGRRPRAGARGGPPHRPLAVKSGELRRAELDAWYKELHQDFERALAETKLPERPDYEAANRFLIKAGRGSAGKIRKQQLAHERKQP
jgi:hypothetical protein